jgi:hypothetical protein
MCFYISLETCGCSKGKYLPATITTVAETFTYIQASFVDAKFMVCGLGGKKKKIECVDVIIIDPSTGNCRNPDGSGDPYTPPDGYFCIQTLSGASLSAGDFGGNFFVKLNFLKNKFLIFYIVGPVYLYQTRPGPKGQIIITESITIIGLIVGDIFVDIIHQEWISLILKMKSELVCLR